jgi:hypothetical protein
VVAQLERVDGQDEPVLEPDDEEGADAPILGGDPRDTVRQFDLRCHASPFGGALAASPASGQSVAGRALNVQT